MADGNDCQKTGIENDKEPETDSIDSLLDSALDDFNHSLKEQPVVEKSQSDSTTTSNVDDVETMWSEMMKQALKLDPNIRDLLDQGSSEQNAFAQDFSKIAEVASKVMEDETVLSQNNFADIMAETLKNLQENSETIQNQFGSSEEMANLFQQLGLHNGAEEPEGSFENIPPFMQQLMQSFLSKEVLYPSMKDFVTRYPLWLEEHKNSLTAEQYETYSKQLELMRNVVEEFEAESDSDSEEVKKLRFQRIMEYMQQMQALGQPPSDLINEGTLDEATMPSLPPGMDPNQCCTM